MIYRLIIFLILNFSALAIGGLFTGKGVASDWYQNLDKAPWTPPGWVFGFAWTTIMICFTIYMAYAWKTIENLRLLAFLFVVQWILNVLWTPLFFKYHQVLIGLIVIVCLTVVIGYFFFAYYSQLKLKVLLVLPYFLWLLVATSLNAYIYLNSFR